EGPGEEARVEPDHDPVRGLLLSLQPLRGGLGDGADVLERVVVGNHAAPPVRPELDGLLRHDPPDSVGCCPVDGAAAPAVDVSSEAGSMRSPSMVTPDGIEAPCAMTDSRIRAPAPTVTPVARMESA